MRGDPERVLDLVEVGARVAGHIRGAAARGTWPGRRRRRCVRPASSTAPSTASMVSWNAERSTWRPTADCPTPEITARRSATSGIGDHSPAGRFPSGRFPRADSQPLTTKLGTANPSGPGSKPTATSMPITDLVGWAAAQTTDHPHARVLVELDQHDGERHLHVGHPPLVVDREAVDASRSGDLDPGGRTRAGRHDRSHAVGTSRSSRTRTARRAGGPHAPRPTTARSPR